MRPGKTSITGHTFCPSGKSIRMAFPIKNGRWPAPTPKIRHIICPISRNARRGETAYDNGKTRGHAPRPQRDARAHAAASTRCRDARARFSRKPTDGRGEKAMRARRQPQRADRSSPRARRLKAGIPQRRCPPRTPPVPRKGRRAISGSVSSPCYATSSSLKRPRNVR